MTDAILTGHVHADQLEAARCKVGLFASPTRDEIARQVQARTHGRWVCWYGHSTGRYWAIRTAPGPFRLVEGNTPKELLIAMSELDACAGLFASRLPGVSLNPPKSRSRSA